MREKRLILQLNRGLYQLPGAGGDANQMLIVRSATRCFTRVSRSTPSRASRCRCTVCQRRSSIYSATDRAPSLNLAREGLREALRQRKASPAEVAEYANDAGIWKVV